tara:strand:- start:13 stop:360 length:348 start_codon:yes stop_codon:yes gene_type:complete
VNFKREEIDLLLKKCSIKLDFKEYNELCRILWVSLNGATFEIKNPWSSDFLRDCEDIWKNENNVSKMIIENSPNIIDFKERKEKLIQDLYEECENLKMRNDPDIIPDDFEADDEP